MLLDNFIKWESTGQHTEGEELLNRSELARPLSKTIKTLLTEIRFEAKLRQFAQETQTFSYYRREHKDTLNTELRQNWRLGKAPPTLTLTPPPSTPFLTLKERRRRQKRSEKSEDRVKECQAGENTLQHAKQLGMKTISIELEMRGKIGIQLSTMHSTQDYCNKVDTVGNTSD